MASVVYRVGDDVSTDAIYPGRYMATVLPSETPEYCFANDTVFNGKLRASQVPPGSIIVAGRNFGCGSSREQAASTLKGWGLVVVAEDIARIFLQNAVNLGLQVVTAPGVRASEGDDLVILADRVENRTSGESFPIVPLPKARQAIIDAGGLVAYTRTRLMSLRAGETPLP